MRPWHKASNRRWEETRRAKRELWEAGGKKLKLRGKWCGTAAEEGGVHECIEVKDFARLPLKLRQ